MDGDDLKALLREAFDSQVLNHGDFNLVYGRPSGSGNPWIIGYRRHPLELLLCPVDLETLPGQRDDLPLAAVALDNVATLADTGTGYQVETVTGFRAWFEVTSTPRVHLPENLRDRLAASATTASIHGDGALSIEQDADAEDFHQFMSHFMDTLDSFYDDGT